jgi:hypothetical protein
MHGIAFELSLERVDHEILPFGPRNHLLMLPWETIEGRSWMISLHKVIYRWYVKCLIDWKSCCLESKRRSELPSWSESTTLTLWALPCSFKPSLHLYILYKHQERCQECLIACGVWTSVRVWLFHHFRSNFSLPAINTQLLPHELLCFITRKSTSEFSLLKSTANAYSVSIQYSVDEICFARLIDGKQRLFTEPAQKT